METQAPLEIYDVYDIIEQSYWQKEWFFFASLGLLVAFFLFIFLWRRRAHRLLLKSMINPWEYAEQQLNQLVVPEGLLQEEHKKFYSSLTHLLKQYLHHRYLLDEGNTDQELIEALKKKMIDAVALRQLHMIIHHAFTVKFAHSTAPFEHMSKDKAAAYEVVALTKPQEVSQEVSDRVL